MQHKARKKVPTCGKCGRAHYNMLPCPVPEKVDSPPVEWGASMEGWNMFGDFSDKHEFLGGRTLLLKKDK